MKTSVKSLSRFDIALVLGLLALAPMLYLQATNLTSKPHFQFFPLAWAMFAWLVFLRGKVADSESRLRVAFGSLGWILYLCVAVASIVYFSPWMAQVATIFLVAGWLLLRLDGNPWYQPLGWLMLLLITLPLPRNLDQRLIQSLQTWSSRSASAMLDNLGLPHYASGNILEVRSGPLFVDEACSGVDSLYALAAVALAIVIFQSRSLLPSILVLCSVPVWAWLGNLIRIFGIAVMLDYWQLDLTHGWPHTVLGLVTFGFSSLCLIITQAAVTQVLAPFPVRSVTSDGLHKAYNRVVYFPRLDPTARAQMSKKAASSLTPAFRKYSFAVTSCVCLMSIAIAGVALAAANQLGPWKQVRLQLPRYTKATVDTVFNEQSLPNDLSGMSRGGFFTTQRDVNHVNGEFSATWQYVDGPFQALISLDFPFAGFHALEECYVLSGGSLVAPVAEVGVAAEESLEGVSIYEMRIAKPLSEDTYICYCLFDATGSQLQNKNRTLIPTLQSADRPAYQTQLVVEGCGELSEAQKERYRNILLSAKASLLPLVIAAPAE